MAKNGCATTHNNYNYHIDRFLFDNCFNAQIHSMNNNKTHIISSAQNLFNSKLYTVPPCTGNITLSVNATFFYCCLDLVQNFYQQH